MTGRPRVLLVHQRRTLPWIFDAAARTGVDLVLVPRDDEQDTADLPPGVASLLRIDVTAPDAIRALRAEHERHPFDGIVTLFEPSVPFVAAAARELGLPGLDPDVAERVRDKRVMREAVRAAGLNSPRFVTLADPDDWARAADVPLPVVVKPSHGFSSTGVTRVDDPAALERTVRDVWRAGGGTGGLVVEEYIDGPEFAVESLAFDGEVRVLSVGYKGEPVGPYFEEGVYRAPADLQPDVRRAVHAEVVAAHEALGVRNGPTHTELRLRGGTVAYLLELGARIGGSGVSHHIVRSVTGVDLAAETLRVATGLRPECFADDIRSSGAGGNYIVPCNGHGRIVAIDGLAGVAALPEVGHVVQMLFPGDEVRPYPEFTGYPAFVLSTHRDLAELERFHTTLADTVAVRYRPVEVS